MALRAALLTVIVLAVIDVTFQENCEILRLTCYKE